MIGIYSQPISYPPIRRKILDFRNGRKEWMNNSDKGKK